MNLALWLERAGMSHGDRPALGLGSRVVRSYAECAGRVARLAASLRQRFGLEAGERVAIVAKNSPDYLELMFGIWHAGLNGNKDWGNTFQQYSNDNNLMIAAAASGVLPCLLSVLLTGDMFALFAGAAGVVIGLFALIAAKGAKGVPLRRRDESIQRARPLQRRLPRLRDRYLQEQPLGLHPEQGERAITNRSTILARCGVGGAGRKRLAGAGR
jgi:hypothetical protein